MSRRNAMCLAVVIIALYFLTGCWGTRQTESGEASGIVAGQPVVVKWTRDSDSHTNIEIPPALVSAMTSGLGTTPWGAVLAGGASIVGAWAAAKAQSNSKRADEHKADADEAWAKLVDK
jgi:hypothetical protein